MKFTKKCNNTQHKISIRSKLDKLLDRRCSSAGMFYTSSAGAVTSLILVVAISVFLNLIGLIEVTNTYAVDSISMTVDTNNLAINMAPLTSDGEFAKSGNMNISVSTTSDSGYTLSIASSTGSTDLKSGQNTIASIGSAIDENTFSTSSTYNNKWGYKPSHLYNSSTEQIVTNNNFRPLPNNNGEIIAKTVCANGTSPCTSATDNYSLSIATRTTITTPIGDYASDTFVIAAVTNKGVVSCDDTKLCVEYDGNGLSFSETSEQLARNVNNVNYNSTPTSSTVTKYSHTSNFSDDGTKSGVYASNLATKDVVSIPGASELNVTITYGTENNWDMLYVFQGEYTGSIGRNMDQSSTGWLYKYMGGNNTPTTVTITIPGDTATFGFYSDGSSQYYGYYAVITGTGTVIQRTVSSGEYATPAGTDALFHGWSSTQTTAGGGLPSDVEYANESEVMTKMPGDEGEAKTLYAVWQQGQTITFTMDSNVSSIAVLDSNKTTVGTITASGQSLVLAQGDTYTLKPTHATGYSTNAITKTTGTGTISGKSFTVGAGSATINVTSKLLSPIQNFNCSTLLNIGDTEEVYDTRDNEVYLIGKLADNKCWMLDNLRLDLTNSDIVDGLTSTNTNASDEALGYLKGTTTPRNPSTDSTGKWPTAALTKSNWTSSYSYSAPLVNVSGTFSGNPYTKDTVVTSYGEGSGKIGVYYNYCAASAGSYCHGNDTQNTGSPSSDPVSGSLRDITDDICPKGWRMPTSSSSGEYQALYAAYSSASEGQQNAFRANLSTPLSGYFLSGSAYYQGSIGNFWSSTWIDNTSSMYVLYVGAGYVYPSSSNYRYVGNSVRCTLDS